MSFLSLSFVAASLVQPKPQPLKPLRFEMSVSLKSSLAIGGMEVLSNIFKKHGYEITFEELPLQRGLEELKKGRLDGSAGRVANTGILYGITGYERLEVPITYSTLAMWCRPSYDQDAKRRILTLGYLRGSVVASDLAGSVDKTKITALSLNSYEAAAGMLVNGRLDCMLGWTWIFEENLAGPVDVSHMKRFLLVTHPYFTWISKALAPLKKELEQQLRDYPFAVEWSRKYRMDKAICRDTFEVLCPDGVIFKADPADIEAVGTQKDTGVK